MHKPRSEMENLLSSMHLTHFPAALVFGETDVFLYSWSTITGLVRIRQSSVHIIAIENMEKHNGEFLRFIERMESAANESFVTFTVGDFMNTRLREWFIRRGYSYSKRYDTVIYRNK